MKNTLLISSIFVALSIFGARPASAASTVIPNCWKESGEDLVDGRFIIVVSGNGLTGEQLLDVMELANSANTTSEFHPAFDHKLNIYMTSASESSCVGPGCPTRAHLKMETIHQIQKLINTGTVQHIECDYVQHIDPAVGVRN